MCIVHTVCVCVPASVLRGVRARSRLARRGAPAHPGRPRFRTGATTAEELLHTTRFEAYIKIVDSSATLQPSVFIYRHLLLIGLLRM